MSMNHPETGKMICDPEELKNASVEYLSTLLKNRDPKEEFEEDFKTLRLLHEHRMSEEHSGNEILTENDFQEMMKKIKKKKADKYKFILKAGKSYHHGRKQAAQCYLKGKEVKMNLEIRDSSILKRKF